MRLHYGLWTVTPSAKTPVHIFKNVDTGRVHRRHDMRDGFYAKVAHEFVQYLNSRTPFPVYQIGGRRHSKPRR